MSFSGFTSEELVIAFKDLRNLHLISYGDGLIDNGKFIGLFSMTCIVPFWRLSLRHAAFVFVLKLKVTTDLEQLLTCGYSKFWLPKEFSAAAMFSHICPLSKLLITISCSGVHWK